MWSPLSYSTINLSARHREKDDRREKKEEVRLVVVVGGVVIHFFSAPTSFKSAYQPNDWMIFLFLHNSHVVLLPHQGATTGYATKSLCSFLHI